MNWYKQAQFDINWKNLIAAVGVGALISLATMWGLNLFELRKTYEQNPQKVEQALEQKENNLATVTLLKSRIGKDGIVFTNCLFNNEMLEIDTDTQNTLLGHAEQRAEEKQQRAIDVYKARKEKEKLRVEIDIQELIQKKRELRHGFTELKHEIKEYDGANDDEVINPPLDNTEEIKEMSPEEKKRRAVEAYKAARAAQMELQEIHND